MKKYIPLQRIFSKPEESRLYQYFDRVSFGQIFLIWILIIILFGLLYHFYANSANYLKPTQTHLPIDMIDAIYFSFITATSTGFGDIVPIGLNRVIALVEVIIGLTLFAMVTSKLVSIKQESILNEIYDIALTERINRLRSSLYLFRTDIYRLIMQVEEGSMKKRESNLIWTNFSFYDDILNEINRLYKSKRKGTFVKDIDLINTRLFLNSIDQSMSRTLELVNVLDLNEVDWRREINLTTIKDVVSKTQSIVDRIEKEGDELSDISKSIKESIKSINEQLEVKK